MASIKKSKSKASKSRPTATASVSQPVVEDASYLTALSSFSPDGNFFSYLSLAVDKHRLRVYDTTTGQSEAEYIAESSRVSALAWCEFLEKEIDDDSLPTKKKRRKSRSGEGSTQKKKTTLIGLGLSNGTVVFFSPTHGHVLWTLSHSSSTSAILSIVSVMQKDDSPYVWTSGADGVVRSWNVHKNELLGTWKNADRIPYSSISVRPGTEDTTEVLAASHAIRLLTTESDLSGQKLKELASFTGHSSPVKNLQWDASQTPSQRFVSIAEADRVVSIWEVPQSASQGNMIASVQLDSDARAISLTSPPSPSKPTLLTLSASGRISIYPIPEELSYDSSQKAQKLPTLLPRSTLSISSKNASTVVAASFITQEPGRVRVARIVDGVKPVFSVAQYQDDSGNFVADIVIEHVQPDSVAKSSIGAPNKRYTESSTLAVSSGHQVGQDIEMDEVEAQNADGDLDVDLAELSLGQRLTALSGAEALPEDSDEDSDDDDNEGASSSKRQKSKMKNNEFSIVPAASLTRTLIQALHSSDSKLLEMCLAHSDPILIRNTVRRLPPQLAVPLIAACVERLGRGARGSNMKGGGGGASSQRGTGLNTWIKTVLTIHSGHLMTMPDLVARLAGLHATLTSRLSLQENLLNLGGRLDMVLSQIEMRSSVAPATLGPKAGKQTPKKKTETTHYVEGESEEEEEQMDVDVEVESGDDEGSIENVDLGGSSDESSDEEEGEEEGDEEDDEEDDEDDSEGPTMNGFIDDEAEEEFTDDEEGDESE
ncbi:NUC189-domain-containing protein [Dendrothele bispora CBS 962.96]|uniref:NUC189-domain-containing protein n=1 Tax=Dendrothele bispora (strain CBS 962.96) TaxID=1314807 RepID=A0A4S8LH92_DENBC|nr:NUC189-domain-containing protein [Dendrothele bispora CBS 962.96]